MGSILEVFSAQRVPQTPLGAPIGAEGGPKGRLGDPGEHLGPPLEAIGALGEPHWAPRGAPLGAQGGPKELPETSWNPNVSL